MNAQLSTQTVPDKSDEIFKTGKLKKEKSYTLITVTSIITALIIWEIIGRQINPILASSPSQIVVAFWKMLLDGSIVSAFFKSIQAFLVGYLLSAVIGIPLGLFIGRYRSVEAALGIYITAGYSTPLVALVPLFVLWFGLGFTVKVAIIFSLTVFPIIINTWAGVHSVPKSLLEVGKSFVASQTHIMRKIIIPFTLPYIMTGLRLGVGKAVIAMVIAEFFTAIDGLGGIIINSGNNFKTAAMFVPVVILMVLGVGLTALVGKLEKVIAPWQNEISGRE